MSITIKYTKHYRTEVTEKDTFELSAYEKKTFINGEIRQIDEYHNSKLLRIYYYKRTLEKDEDILSKIFLEKSFNESIIIIEKVQEASHTIEYRRKYYENYRNSTHKSLLYPFIEKSLLDSLGRVICDEETTLEKCYNMNLIDHAPVVSMRKKYYYVGNRADLDGFKFEIEYGINDNLHRVTEIFPSDWEYDYWHEQDREHYDLKKLAERHHFNDAQRKYYFTDAFLPDEPSDFYE